MKIGSEVTCARCHRQYAGARSACPFCGEPRPQEEKRAVPSAASTVPGSEAARQAGANMNFQMIIGGVLLLAIIIAVIGLVSTNINARLNAAQEIVEAEEQEAEEMAGATAPPTPTAEPTPSPTPEPTVTSIAVTFMGNQTTGFMEQVGDEIQLDASWYPSNIEATVEWSSSDENVATVSSSGLVTLISSGHCTVSAQIGACIQTIDVWVE